MSELKPMTRSGYVTLVNELKELRDHIRPKVVDGIATAAAEGDRSENAEYIYGKKRLRELDRRLRYLSGLIKDVTIIDEAKISCDQVSFGSVVTLKDLEDDTLRIYQIVGVGEADADQGTISVKSAVAKAIKGKRVGDIVSVETPARDREYEVLKIDLKSI